MQRNERVFFAIQNTLAGAAIEDVAAELEMTPEELVAELEAELEAAGVNTHDLAVDESGELVEALAEIRRLPESPDRDG